MSAETLSIRGRWARQLVRETVYADLQAKRRQESTISHRDGLVVGAPIGVPSVDTYSPNNLPTDRRRLAPEMHARMAALSTDSDGIEPQSKEAYHFPTLPKGSKVCIVGAGVAGLYIAMILEDLQILNLSYEILESSPRVGGRLYTHYFTPLEENPHDYYDIGAMRYPDITVMKRTFDLFRNRLGFDDKKLVKYYLDPTDPKKPRVQGSVFTPTRYNDINKVNDDPRDPVDFTGFDPFKVSQSYHGSVSDEVVERGLDYYLGKAFGDFKGKLETNFDEGYKALMKVDRYSTRQYLAEELKLGYYSVQWLETNNTSSGLFDQAFTESVMDSFDFTMANKMSKGWFCVEGGTSEVTKAMKEKIKGEIKTSHRVTKIGMDDTEDKNLYVEVAGGETRRNLCTVFNTTSLGCLQRVDLTELELHPSQKDAIRCLHYDDSCKVAIKFKYPWWITECGIKFGGTGNSDMPLRTCVYPSYNIDDPVDQPSILLCSYTWAQDAARIGSLIGDQERESKLMELMFDNLAKLHLDNFQINSKKASTLSDVRKLIKEAYVTHHAFSWTHDSDTSGAFALFGPNQFRRLYPYLIRPAGRGKFHMVGEASSAHHAWIVGSLDSAYAAVHKFLNKYEMWDYMKILEATWGDKYGIVADVEDRPVPPYDGPEDKAPKEDSGTEWLQIMLSGGLPAGEAIVGH